MTEYLKINPNDPVKIKGTKIPKGSYLKIQPHQMQFIKLKDPKNILEKQLSKYSCLTKDSTIFIEYNDFVYKFDILELLNEDKKECTCISIIDVDLNIDFAKPLDMPPTPPQKYLQQECQEEKNKAFVSFSGKGKTLGCSNLDNSCQNYQDLSKSSIKNPDYKKQEVQPEIRQNIPKTEFKPFVGNGKVLGSNIEELNMFSVGLDIAKDISSKKKTNKKDKKE